MPTFLLRRIHAPTWQAFQAKAKQLGVPARWLLLQVIEDVATGKYVIEAARRPPEESPPTRQRTPDTDPAPAGAWDI